MKDVKQSNCLHNPGCGATVSLGRGPAAASFCLLPGDSSLQAKADWDLVRTKVRYRFPPLKERPGRQSQAVLGAQALPRPVLIKGLLTAPEPQQELGPCSFTLPSFFPTDCGCPPHQPDQLVHGKFRHLPQR